jgi:hypothetical protein
MNFEVDDGGDPTYPIRTEVFADIGNLKGQKVTLDSGATFPVSLRTYVYKQDWEKIFVLPG